MKTFVDWMLLRPLAGQRTSWLVFAAFWLNIACYFHLDTPTDPYKLAVQQALILCIGSLGAKLDRLRK